MIWKKKIKNRTTEVKFFFLLFDTLNTTSHLFTPENHKFSPNSANKILKTIDLGEKLILKGGDEFLR